jgi:type II secretory pathway pseudopilin PulG
MRMKSPGARRGERGNVLVFVTLALIALFGFAAWSTETGQAWSARGQLQAASDSAALAGAGELFVPNSGQQSDPAAATAAAQAFGVEHQVAKDPVDILAADVEAGRWSLQTRTFTPLPGSTDPQEVRAVRVMGRRDDTANGALPTVLGRIMGVDSIPISTEAIAYIGYAGLMPPGTALLPIALDCCQISGATCDQSYCEYVQNDPPKPCQLGPASDNPGKWVSCLEFASSNGEQNACWTELDAVDGSINTPGLKDIIVDGNPVAVGNDPIYVDNGTKTAVLNEIFDRFHDSGQYSSDPNGGGSDTNNNGTNDSWLVPLPIVECQYPGDGCAGGSAQRIVGVACFDVQEVDGAPDKIIKGEFVCPGDPRWDASKCSVGFGPGGEVPTIDAQYPVLVD